MSSLFVYGACGVFRAPRVFHLGFSLCFAASFLSSCCALGWSFLAPLVRFLPYSSCGACGLVQLPLPQVPFGVSASFSPRLPVLLLHRWCRLVSRPVPCVLSASPTQAALPLFAGSSALCQGYVTRVVSSLELVVWRCHRVPQVLGLCLLGGQGSFLPSCGSRPMGLRCSILFLVSRSSG